MPNYETLYHLLFNAVTDAIEALEAGRTVQARQLLIRGQQKAEALYIGEGEDDPVRRP